MKISYNWLREYIDFDKTPAELADDLSLFGHQVESTEKMGDDTVLDLEITPNRGDCLSILGIAREVAALYKLKIKDYKLKIDIKDNKLNKEINIKIQSPKICPRFTSRIIDKIKIEESPKWIQEKLATYGFRPINNIVDITNYVMVATGQPLHAFDYDKITNGIMNVRQAKNGEEIITLDGQVRNLEDGDIIIEDEEKIYDLAGIMGGLKSEVDKNTKTIILQGAIFDPTQIRQTSKHLAHITDASYRYERSVDFEGTVKGVDYASSIIKTLLPEAKIGKKIDIISEKPKTKIISLDISKVNQLLGTNISINNAYKYLELLGFKIRDGKIEVPCFRSFDIHIWQDLAEEIARMYGYNKISRKEFKKSQGKIDLEYQKREIIKNLLTNIGFTEIYTYSFIDEKSLKNINVLPKNVPEIEKPISPETQYLRPSLLPSMLNMISKNPWAPEIVIFELEKVFDKSSEKWQLGLASVGKSDEYLACACKILKMNPEIKSVDQSILDLYKIRRIVKYQLIDISKIDGRSILKSNIQYNNAKYYSNKYRIISKYSPTIRDLSFIFPKGISSTDVIKTIYDINKAILIAELFDFYKISDDKISLAFHIWLQDLNGPMTETQTDDLIAEIIDIVSNKYRGNLRSKK